MKRYSIMVTDHWGGKEHELCQCDSNPKAIAEAAGQQKVLLSTLGEGRRIATAKYSSIRIVDHKKGS